MRSADNEKLILAMWEDYEREGLPGILRWAADDARWRPHSRWAGVRGTAIYRERWSARVSPGFAWRA